MLISRLFVAKAVALLLTVLSVASAWAQTKQEPQPASPAVAAAVKKSVEGWLKGRFKVDAVNKTPMPGMVEALIGSDLIYVDEKGGFAFIEGQMINLKTGQNVTAARQEALQAIDFKALPLDLAMKTVRGKGGDAQQRTLVVFEDPYCSFCKRFRAVLMGLENVTIYTYFYPILRPESTTVSRNAWCAKDREAAWEDWMLNGKEPPPAPANCDFPKDKILALGQRLNVQATPTTFVPSGKRLQGALTAPALEEALKR
ncbi:MAG: DsbC family protein [Betaproteobacteria bacterium]|nr:DsbC family protein [Betaproteobacteria bacterium]